MLTSALIFMTLLPLQAAPGAKQAITLNKPVLVAAFVDSAKILGLPKFKLRDGKGNLYSPHQTLLQEPLAHIQYSAGINPVSELNKRKAFITSYVRR